MAQCLVKHRNKFTFFYVTSTLDGFPVSTLLRASRSTKPLTLIGSLWAALTMLPFLCLAFTSTMKMAAACLRNTDNNYKTIRNHIPEDSRVFSHSGSLRSVIIQNWLTYEQSGISNLLSFYVLPTYGHTLNHKRVLPQTNYMSTWVGVCVRACLWVGEARRGGREQLNQLTSHNWIANFKITLQCRRWCVGA
jgi:hypothetical protein